MELFDYRADQFIFIDESGVNKRDGLRRIGWASKGVKPRHAVSSGGKTRSIRFQILPGLTMNGVLAFSVYSGVTDKEGFLD